MTVHRLKTNPLYFIAAQKGMKTFEIRENDRNYQIGDVFISMEYDSLSNTYTGNELRGSISYITDYMQQPGYVVLGIWWDNNL